MVFAIINLDDMDVGIKYACMGWYYTKEDAMDERLRLLEKESYLDLYIQEVPVDQVACGSYDDDDEED